MRVDAALSFPENTQPDKVGQSGSTTQKSRPAAVATGQDQAQLSVDSATIQQLNVKLAQLPDVRQDRVDALRQAVSTGSYQISDQQLGNAIASDMFG